MRFLRALALPALVPVFLSGPAAGTVEDLTFEQRVRAQEAIERVYHAHRFGGAPPFEEAVPRALLEARVHGYLRRSAALERVWHTPVTGEMLYREASRMARGTLLPGRLRELHAALGHDPLLIQECLVRPVLVNRLARSFFAHDRTIHGATRRQAEALREELTSGRIDPRAPHSRRRLARLVRTAAGGDTPLDEVLHGIRDEGVPRITLSSADYTRRREALPTLPGQIGPLIEGKEGFIVGVVLEEGPDDCLVAWYRVEKRTWDEWWSGIEGSLDTASVRMVASPEAGLPDPLADTSYPPCLPDDTWDNGSLDDVPSRREEHTAIWTGTEMIVWGGEGLNSGGRYDPATDSWTATTRIGAPSGREEHTAVWTGTEMIVWGGYPFIDTGGRYNPVTDTWTPTSTTGAPVGRGQHTAVWTGDEMIVWGGYPDLDTGGRYDPAADTWTPTTLSKVPLARRFHTAVWTGEEMVIWGGDNYGEGYLNSGGRYDPQHDRWYSMAVGNAPTPRDRHTAVWTGSKMIVWGGHSNPSQWVNTGGRYDPGQDQWAPTSTVNAPSDRGYHTAVWTGARMLVWGGYGSPSYLDSGGLYDPVGDAWTTTTTLNAPSARRRHSAVWTGDRMIVWGGYNYTEFELSSGGRYDPVGDSWTPTATSDTPVAREFSTSVWTGASMIVWGGRKTGGHIVYLDSGGRYDPATDSWSATPMAHAPSERVEHSAVWTGREMIVWGGTDIYGYVANLNTGARYDPLWDRWTPLPTPGLTPRKNQSAIWTGTEMIVWGGSRGLETRIPDGGRFDPATNTWSRLTLDGAPSPRSLHTAVWTGTEMLVWGGMRWDQDLGWQYPQAGGRYDPDLDLWSPLSTVSAPPGRVRHATIWNGNEMIVWGGYDGGYPLESGGRYDPVSDTWTATSLIDAPSPRYAHTGVWLGSRMVTWGGRNQNVPGTFDTGGRYDPASDTWTPTEVVEAPRARRGHVAVSTGASMLVWGGTFATGGRYMLGHAQDDDGDGWSECDGDCNDASADAYPGATEICDGIDNDCDGTVDRDAVLPDTDGDGIADCLDSCPLMPSSDQADADGDGVGDPCDCAPLDEGAWAAPSEVTGLRWLDTEILLWDSAVPFTGDDTRHDVVRGAVEELPVGAGPAETCLAADLAEAATTDASLPDPGMARWYLVRAGNVCGSGGYGETSGEGPRVTDACGP